MRLTLTLFLTALMGCASRPVQQPAGASPGIPIVSKTDIGSRTVHIVRQVYAHTCTTRLGQPADGLPSAAEALARQRLSLAAARWKADAVANVTCFREILIGFGCPSRVRCSGDAIRFE